MPTIAQLFKTSFKQHGTKTAISFLRGKQVETRLSYADVDRISDRMATRLLGMGVARSDHVVFLLDKSLVFVVVYIALQKIGAACVPLNPGFKESELTYLLKDAEPCLVIVNKELAGRVKQIDPHLSCMEIQPDLPLFQALDLGCGPDGFEAPGPRVDDPGLLVYTSGTTGNPKGVVLTQKNLMNDAKNIIEIWEITREDTLCHALPLFHIHGLCFALHTALVSGAHVVLLDRFDARIVLDILKQNRGDLSCTVFMGVPTMYLSLINSMGDQTLGFDHMRLWTSGSAPLPVWDFERILRVFGKEPVEREGMSETGMNFSNPLHGKKKPGSIGIPLPGVEVRIVDPDTFQDVQDGVGEIWLKSDSITPGYWGKHDETVKAFYQGWFRTGDIGKKDGDGYYYLTDRLKNIIITGGENVSPSEVEAVINGLDEVLESSVMGVSDEKWGERIVVAVVKKPGTGDITDAIKTVCKLHLHDWKCPKQIVFLKKLPRNTMGKILKQKLKKLF